MATLVFNEQSYVVDHAVKGSNYINGYDANGIGIVSIQNITDFSGISYDGVYLTPEECPEEPYNFLKVVNGYLTKKVRANADAALDITAPQVRDIYAGTADMTPGVTALPTGVLYVMYE